MGDRFWSKQSPIQQPCLCTRCCSRQPCKYRRCLAGAAWSTVSVRTVFMMRLCCGSGLFAMAPAKCCLLGPLKQLQRERYISIHTLSANAVDSCSFGFARGAPESCIFGQQTETLARKNGHLSTCAQWLYLVMYGRTEHTFCPNATPTAAYIQCSVSQSRAVRHRPSRVFEAHALSTAVSLTELTCRAAPPCRVSVPPSGACRLLSTKVLRRRSVGSPICPLSYC